MAEKKEDHTVRRLLVGNPISATIGAKKGKKWQAFKDTAGHVIKRTAQGTGIGVAGGAAIGAGAALASKGKYKVRRGAAAGAGLGAYLGSHGGSIAGHFDSTAKKLHDKHASAFTAGFNKIANVLTTKARKQIKEENFALPGRRYPIENKAHAANAKARVAQYGTPAEIAAVNAAVAKKYPNMGKEAGVDQAIRTATVMGKRYGRQALSVAKKNPIASTAVGAGVAGMGLGAMMAGKKQDGQ